MNNLLGKMLGNRYLVIEKIGEGGMALVYKAKDQLLNRYVAIKILRPEYTNDEDFVNKFKRESVAAASLSHPNIVGIYDVGEQDGIYYIVMEYVKGLTLKQYIRNNTKLNYKETLKITMQIAEALEHAHKNGVIHRDIKSQNILITDDKIAKVTDFGIARAASSSTMTNTERIMGSVHYFSPEQARGGYTDHRTDIYSLGVVMYEMLTGRLPYDAESPVSVALKHIQDSIIEPSCVCPEIPKAVNDIVVKTMEKDMAKRYQNAGALIKDLIIAENNPDAVLYNRNVDDEATRIIPVREIDKALEKNIKKPKKKKKIIPILVVTLISVILIGLFYLGYNKFFVVKDVQVPPVVGMDVNDAKKVLEDNHLIMEIANRVSSDKPEGQVLRILPDEETTVKQNSIVRVTISTGLEKVTVPDIKNEDTITAQAMLKKAGLSLGNVDYNYSDTINKDLIIEQIPKANESVQKNSSVDIVISSGPQITLVTVPDLTGDTIDKAKDEIKKNNLTLGSINYGTNTNYADGVVIGQSIQQGTKVEGNQEISITINKLPTDTGTQNTNQNQTNNSGNQ